MSGFPIPQDFPLANLVGQEVTQVCIGSHDIRINLYKLLPQAGALNKWEAGAVIDIETGFVLNLRGQPRYEASNENLGECGGCLTALLKQQIGAVERLPNNELLIRFSNGAELQLLTDPQGFESYHLHVEGQSIDVTKPW